MAIDKWGSDSALMKSGEWSLALDDLRTMAASDNKRTARKGSRQLKTLEGRMTKLGLDPANPPVPQPVGEKGYSELLGDLTSAPSDLIGATSTGLNKREKLVREMVNKMRAASEEIANIQKDWTDAGNPGQAPQIGEMKAERLQLEQNAKDLGFSPGMEFDDWRDDQNALIEQYGADWKEHTGDLNEQLEADRLRMQEEFQETGSLGKYSDLGEDVTQRQSEMMGKDFQGEFQGNTVENLAALKAGIQDDSALNAGVRANMEASTRGELTSPESAWLKSQMDAREPYIQDAQRSITEAAGAQRGIGGGRLNKQLADNEGRMRGDILAQLNDLQAKTASQAIDYQAGRRGQDVNLAGQAAGMQSNVAGIQAGATTRQGAFAGQRSAADYQREQDNRTMLAQPLANRMGTDSAILGARNTQQGALQQDKNFQAEFFENPMDKAMNDAMDLQDLREWDPGKSTGFASKQRKAGSQLAKLKKLRGGL